MTTQSMQSGHSGRRTSHRASEAGSDNYPDSQKMQMPTHDPQTIMLGDWLQSLKVDSNSLPPQTGSHGTGGGHSSGAAPSGPPSRMSIDDEDDKVRDIHHVEASSGSNAASRSNPFAVDAYRALNMGDGFSPGKQIPGFSLLFFYNRADVLCYRIYMSMLSFCVAWRARTDYPPVFKLSKPETPSNARPSSYSSAGGKASFQSSHGKGSKVLGRIDKSQRASYAESRRLRDKRVRHLGSARYDIQKNEQ